MTQKNLSPIEQSQAKRWLANAIELSGKQQNFITRRDLKSEWRKSAGKRARLA